MDMFKSIRPIPVSRVGMPVVIWQPWVLGDGSKAAQLETEPGDFSKADTQAQPDGSLFYKTTEGRDDMPSFKKKIPDEDDRWALVAFIRTLKK